MYNLDLANKKLLPKTIAAARISGAIWGKVAAGYAAKARLEYEIACALHCLPA